MSRTEGAFTRLERRVLDMSDTSSRSPVFRLFVGLFAEKLVSVAYLGLLARAPDSVGLHAHATELRNSRKLPEILNELIESDEFRKRSLEALAPELIETILQSLFGRKPDPETVRRHASSWSGRCDLRELGRLLSETLGSEEFRARNFAAIAPELVGSAYRGLLARDPEPQARESWSARVAKSGDLSEALSEIVRSEEFRTRSFAAMVPELVGECYRGLLGRDPDPQGLAAYSKRAAEGVRLNKILAEIICSDEFLNKHAAAHPVTSVNAVAGPSRQNVAGFSPRDFETPKLVFLHHPKTGGTTLHHILIKAFDPGEVCPERFNGLRHYAAGELVRYRYFSGHFDLPSVRLIPGRKKIVTLLREPVARLISLYYFQRAHRTEVIEKNKLELARLANLFTIREFFQCPEVRGHPAVNNALTRVLIDTTEGYRWEQETRVEAADSEQDVQLAMEELAGLDAFGIMERYEESVELICDAVGLEAPGKIEQKQVLNVIMEEEPGLKKIEKEPLTDEVRALAASLVESDVKLYAYARSLFEHRLSTLRKRNSALRA